MLNNWPALLLLGCLLGLAVGCDLSTRRIPNWLVLAGLIAAIGCSVTATYTAGNQPSAGSTLGLANSLIGALSGLVIMLPLYALRAMGGGDVKLMAAIGAFLGPMQVLGAALLTFIAGGVLSLIAALWSGSLMRVLSNLRLMGLVTVAGRSAGLSLKDVQTTGRLPYAIAIAVGTGLQVWLAARGGWIFV